MTEGALSHLKVLDLTHHIAGPYATKLLSGLGANVIKVERPDGGDPLRRIGPFYQDLPGPDHSCPFLYLNTDKQSVTLNLKTPTGVAMFKRLCAWSDVVVESFRPGEMAAFSLAYEDLEKVKPGIIMVSISNFGQTGPYRDYAMTDMTAQAIGGVMVIQGEADREPLSLGGYQALYAAGAAAFTATMIAVMARKLRGIGQHVDVSIFEMVANMEWKGTSAYAYDGTLRKRQGRLNDGKILRTKDGFMGALGTSAALQEVIGVPKGDERFATPEARRQNTQAYGEILESWLLSQSKVEAYHQAQALNLTWGYVSDMKDLLESPQYQARSFWREIPHPTVGKGSYARLPFRVGDLPDGPWQPAPRLGEHNATVYGELLGLERGDLGRLRAAGVI